MRSPHFVALALVCAVVATAAAQLPPGEFSSIANRPAAIAAPRDDSGSPVDPEAPRYEIVHSDGIVALAPSPAGRYRSLSDLPSALQRSIAQASVSSPLRLSSADPKTTFVVSDAGDAEDIDLNDGIYAPPTLRSAIQNANKLGGAHTIAFAPGLTAIQPAEALPSVTVAVTIDGTVAAGKITLDGSASSGTTGLLLGGASTVRNVIFSGWNNLGLALGFGTSNSTIQRCEFTQNRVGLNVNGSSCIIGGEDPADRNIAHGNTQNGIALVVSNDNLVQNNYCGTKDGLTASPNGSAGLSVYGQRNRIVANLLSGNTGGGLEMSEFCVATIVRDNLIGVDSSGINRLGNMADGIRTFATRDSILNNVLANNGWGITILGQASETYVRGNVIGLNKTLDSLTGNRFGGVQILGSAAMIDSNLVSANAGNGMLITGWGGAVVRRNMVGTDWTGTLDWGNRWAGIYILCDNNTIGGPAPDDRNILSGNGGGGIEMFGGTTLVIGGPSRPNMVQGNLIEHNHIGTDVTGTVRLSNYTGLFMNGHIDSNVVRNNLIAGNENHGIWTRRSPNAPSRNVFQRNLIGTQTDGVSPLPNDSAAVMVDSARATLFGGPGENDGNTVAFSNQAGIVIKAGSGWTIQRNAIFENNGIGIDLSNNGPTLNDSADADTGANRLQNYPRITWIGRTGASTLVKGYLPSRPNTAYRLEFYTSEKADTTGFGEGQTFRHTADVTTDSAGRAPFEVEFAGTFGRVVATATDPEHGTSEFSKAPLVVNSVADRSDADPNDGLAATNGPQVDGAPEVTLRSALQASNHIEGEDDIAFNIPGTGLHFILPRTALPAAMDNVTIDGSTQPGYVAGEPPAIQLLGDNAGADADGLTLRGDRTTVRALYLAKFTGDGIHMTGERIMLADITANTNKGSGVHAADNVTLEGTNSFNNNGPSADRLSRTCANSNSAGLWYAGLLRGTGTVTASGNCGSGIHHEGREYPNEGGIDLDASLTLTRNSLDGLHARGDVRLNGEQFDFSQNGSPENLAAGIFMASGTLSVEATGAGEGPVIRINGNSFHGISSAAGPVTLKGHAQINNNGAGVTPVRCFNREISGIVAEGRITTGTVETIGNCYDGLRTHASLFVDGNLTVKDHPGRGVWATHNIFLKGEQHLLENNRDQAMWAANGWIEVKGRLTARNNKIGGRHGSEDGPSDMNIEIGAIMAYKDFIGEDLVIENNEPAGLTAWENIRITGNVVVRNNALRGVSAHRNILIEGATHEISGNGGDGLSHNNGFLRVKGHLVLDNNGFGSSIDPDAFEGHGLIGQVVELDDVTMRGNRRFGAVGFRRLLIRGRGIVTGNGSSGLGSSTLVDIAGGRVCENALYGIEAPVVRMSGTQVCRNGRGGILGKVETRLSDSAGVLPPAAVMSADLLVAGSVIRGSAIVDNTGDGVTVDHHLPFRIEGSNLSGNAGNGVRNVGPGEVVAEGNWWGSPSGPAGATSGNVQADSWLISTVGLHVGSTLDSVFVRPGESGSFPVVAANWVHLSDSLSLTAGDASGWLTPVTGRTVAMQDSAPAVLSLAFAIPEAASVGDSSRVIITATSQAEPGPMAADTLHLVVYVPALRDLAILADSLALFSGDTLRINAAGFDQNGRTVPFTPVWSATGGSITQDGIYVAGPDTGVFSVTVADTAGIAADTAVVQIYPHVETLSPALLGLSDTTLALGPVDTSSSASVRLGLTNLAGGLLRIDSIVTRTPFFTVDRPPDVRLLRVGDTLGIFVTFQPDSDRVYHDTLLIYSSAGQSPAAVPLRGMVTVVASAAAAPSIPESYVLRQNYPNPFNPSTTIRFGVPVASRITVRVYDLLGREVARLAEGIVEPGYTQISWSGAVASGVYFCRLEAVSLATPVQRSAQTIRMLMLK